jgi:hypothetical protein
MKDYLAGGGMSGSGGMRGSEAIETKWKTEIILAVYPL